MTEKCTARGSDGACFHAKSEPDDGILAISGSVGAGGINKKEDVRVIQAGLNDVPVSEGGPATPLIVDGINGPLTQKAIANFQKRNLGFSDSRVDTNGPTLRALNGEGGGSADVALAGGAGTKPVRPRKAKEPSLLPNPLIVPLMEALLPEIKAAIRAAQFQLSLARPFVSTQKQRLPQGLFNAPARASLNLLDKVFGFFSFTNPKPVHDRLRLAFDNMGVALNRSFETAPLVSKTLFVPNTKDFMEKRARAYTTAGGAFDGPKARNDLGLPNERIFFCSNLAGATRDQIVMTAIHELAHYVSPKSDPTVDPANGFFFNDRIRMDKLQPRLKIRNAEHYAGYAFLCTGKKTLEDTLRDLLN